MKNRIYKIFFLSQILISFAMSTRVFPFAKSSIYGRVVDQETGSPIFMVNVFLSNTTLGTATNQNGEFIIRNILPNDYNLIFHHIGYKLVSIPINLYKYTNKRIDIKLKSRILKGEEVQVVAPNPNEWRKNLELFTKAFIGTSENANNTKIINPLVIDLKYNSKTKKLIASSDSLIVVENKSLGYKLEIVLDCFEWNFSKFKSTGRYGISPFFKLLIAKNEKEKEKWEQNRRRTFLGSSRHFFYDLVRGGINEEVFKIYSGTIYEINRGMSNYIHPDSLNVDKVENSNLLKFSFDNCLLIENISENQLKPEYSGIILESKYILLDTLGNVLNRFAFSKDGEWFKERVADLLPSNYKVKN